MNRKGELRLGEQGGAVLIDDDGGAAAGGGVEWTL